MKKFHLPWIFRKKSSTAMNSAAKSDANAIIIDGVEDGKADEEGGLTDGNTFFGVKSYLKHFYLSPNYEEGGGRSAFGEDDGAPLLGGGGMSPTSGSIWYLLPPAHGHQHSVLHTLARVLTVVGVLLLMAGAAAIIVGYGWPSMKQTLNADEENNNSIEASLLRIAIDQDEEGNFYIPPERLTEFLKDPMHDWKMAGFCTFAVGASFMALTVLITTAIGCINRRHGGAEPPIRIYSASGIMPGDSKPQPIFTAPHHKFNNIVPAKRAATNRISPTSSGPVPVMEELAKVQPTALKAKISPAISPSSSQGSVTDQLLFSDNNNDSRPLLK